MFYFTRYKIWINRYIVFCTASLFLTCSMPTSLDQGFSSITLKITVENAEKIDKSNSLKKSMAIATVTVTVTGPGMSTITTTLTQSGDAFTGSVEIPKGDPRDPMEADDLAKKIKRFAGDRDEKNLDRIIDIIMNLETLSDVRELSEAL